MSFISHFPQIKKNRIRLVGKGKRERKRQIQMRPMRSQAGEARRSRLSKDDWKRAGRLLEAPSERSGLASLTSSAIKGLYGVISEMVLARRLLKL